MRKLRQAAVVGAMLGSISMFGAGVASADDTAAAPAPQGVTSTDTAAPTSTATPKGKHGGDEINTYIKCDQENDNSVDRRQYGFLNIGDITVPILGSGNADATSNQNICGIGNDENEADADAETENVAYVPGLLG